MQLLNLKLLQEVCLFLHIIGVVGRWRSDGEEEEVFRLVLDTTRGLILEKNDDYEEVEAPLQHP